MTDAPCKRLNVSWARGGGGVRRGGLALRMLTSQKHFATPPPGAAGGRVGVRGMRWEGVGRL